jgi:hypothetical protein
MRATRHSPARSAAADPPGFLRAIASGFLVVTISPFLYLLPYLFGFEASPVVVAAGLVMTWLAATSGLTAIAAGLLDMKATDPARDD